MPIYVEARNVNNAGGAGGGHMYLVYVPEGSENDYDSWRVISAFPSQASTTGPWGLLQVTSQGDFFEDKGGDVGPFDDSYSESLLNTAAGPEAYSASAKRVFDLATENSPN